MKNTWLIFIFFFPFLVSGQDSLFFTRYQHIGLPAADLKKVRAPGAATITENFIEKYRTRTSLSGDSLAPEITTQWKDCCFPAHINGDKLPDMIISGSCNGKLPFTRIFLNRKDSFELVFEDYQYITSLSLRKGVLERIVMADTGAGNDLIFFTREYQAVREPGTLVFRKSRQTAIFRYTEKPEAWLDSIKPFRSAIDTLLLRASAEDIYDPFIASWNTWGNIIAGYTRNIRGNILAEKTDSLNFRWYFIEVIPESLPAKSLFHSLRNGPVFIRGWVREEEVLL